MDLSNECELLVILKFGFIMILNKDFGLKEFIE